MSPWSDVCFTVWTLAAIPVLRRNFQIIHWNMAGLHCCWGMPVAARLGMSNVFLFAGCGQGRQLLDRPRGRRLLASLLRHGRRIIILNSAMEAELLSLGFDRNRLVSLPCEADPDIFCPPSCAERLALRTLWNIPATAQVVVYTGRLIELKRVQDLIRAFVVGRQRNPLALLLIAGDGEQAAALRTLAAQLGLGGAVRFTGQLPSSDVARVLQLSDVLVLPSETEGIPCSLVEALAVGLPVVVTDIPGTKFIGNDIHGLRVPVGDVAALDAAITCLLASPDRRRRMGEAGRRLFLECYTLEAVARGYEEIYRQALAEVG